MILLIDHHDSFTYNIADGFYHLNQEVLVVESDNLNQISLNLDQYSHLVLSPGPGSPFSDSKNSSKEFHPTWKILQSWSPNKPILGICLGHQMLAVWKGGSIEKGKTPIHGKVSKIYHDHSGVFKDCSIPLDGGRYHSLQVVNDSLPSCYSINAWTEDQIIMGIMHKEHPIHGVQFHPDSILTPEGIKIFHNFLNLT
jgi:anthranilate synthase component 2